MTDRRDWYIDEGYRAVIRRLECGHSVEVGEDSGGFDELPGVPPWWLLEQSLDLREKLHKLEHERGDFNEQTAQTIT